MISCWYAWLYYGQANIPLLYNTINSTILYPFYYSFATVPGWIGKNGLGKTVFFTKTPNSRFFLFEQLEYFLLFHKIIRSHKLPQEFIFTQESNAARLQRRI
ncbi:hypothetical protein AZ036_003999 [Klebsiella michiganensis]|uniref:Uncharacterized protein n=1 Tax=Klebsiella michiganensis TaxID=1134687 RepID=A0ABR5G717_9ENTR|nr:hypothetical protein L387_03937 [Klebsiella michiganensis]KLY25738.1 hypothetical protein SK91_05644 [Klebsiella michiganensis]OUG36754.1 hypothetical protein AZ036_003999 [Klebsiella michiganensis]